MAMRRDIYKGERPLDLSLSSDRQIRANCGFPAERTTGRGRCQTLLPQGNKTPWNASGDTLNAYAASHRAVRELKSGGSLPRPVQIRSNKYLNNVVEQDHRRVKQRTDRCWVSSDSIRRASRSAASNWRKRSKRI